MKRKARPLLVVGAGIALIAMANSSCSGNLLPPRPCTDAGGYNCLQQENETDGGQDGGTDGGTDGGDGG